MKDRLIRPRIAQSKKSLLLLGPRQTGKSTICKSLNPDLSVNLALESEYLKLSKHPEHLESLLQYQLDRKSKASPLLVFIDEIQRIPSLLNICQSFIDEHSSRLRILMTGSSARKLKRGGANLLPGRIIQEYLDPLSVFECGEEFDLPRALQVGMLPGVYFDQTEGIDVLDTYASTYLREEIKAEALVKEIGAYSRFIDQLAIISGQWINYSKLSSDTEIPKETIRRFFQICEETLIGFRLPSYGKAKAPNRRVSQRDRFFLFDLGVRNALLGKASHPLSLDDVGPAFEQWFILQAHTLIRAHKIKAECMSFRTDTHQEVDLIVRNGPLTTAYEIKHSKNIGKSDLKGLIAFKAHCKSAKLRIAYLGKESLKLSDGIIVLPWKKALEEVIS